VIAVKVGMSQEWDEWGQRLPLTILWIDECEVGRHPPLPAPQVSQVLHRRCLIMRRRKKVSLPGVSLWAAGAGSADQDGKEGGVLQHATGRGCQEGQAAPSKVASLLIGAIA